MSKFFGSIYEPVHVLDGSRLDELELLLGGLYAPADGYCLPAGLPPGWPWPFTLPVPAALAQKALECNALLLADRDGTPLARLAVSASQSCTPEVLYLAGRLTALQSAEHPPARRLRLTRPLARAATTSCPRLVAAFDRMPEPAQIAAAISSARKHDAQLWLVAVAGPQEHGNYTVLELLSTLEQCAEQVPDSRAALMISPTPQGACDVQKSALRDHVLTRLGADMLLNFTAEREPAGRAATPVPSSPGQGAVIFLTGLSGSGKSTIARSLVEHLQRTGSRPVTLLDGDDVRRLLSSGLGFSRQDRELNVRRLGWVASLISKSGGVAVCAPIAPFEATRQEVRAMALNVGSFVLVHVSTPLDVCEERDRKGLYARARAGSLPDFTGIDSPYEPPRHADVILDASLASVDECVRSILEAAGLPMETLA